MTITDFNVAVINGDTHLSQWIVEQRRLNVQEEYCQLFSKYIPKGGTVIDAGACLGDHTLSYANMVGDGGAVHAFEPNPEAFQCLQYNLKNCPHVTCYELALGAQKGVGVIGRSSTQPENMGAIQIRSIPSEGLPSQKVFVLPLDKMNLRADFIKIDVEGMELDVLQGSEVTIRFYRPVMLIEINRPILALRGSSAELIFEFLTKLDYVIQPSEPHLSLDMENLDVLAIPKEKHGN